jgi:hypothetical protein
VLGNQAARSMASPLSDAPRRELGAAAAAHGLAACGHAVGLASPRRRTSTPHWGRLLVALDAAAGAGSGGAALLFESNDGLTAGDGDFAVDYGAFGDGDAARDDVGVDDSGGADFQFVLDDQLAGDASRDDGGQGVNLAFPL